MKYKIIPEDVVKNIIDFLDEVQFDAAKSKEPDDLHKINFCNWVINELLNGADGFDSENEAESDSKKDWDNYYDQFVDYELPDDMSDDEFQLLMDQFDKFMDKWDKEYSKSNHKKKGSNKSSTLKKFLNQLMVDRRLTLDEKFELYYSEYNKRKRKDESLSFSDLLKKTGIRKSTGGSDTH